MMIDLFYPSRITSRGRDLVVIGCVRGRLGFGMGVMRFSGATIEKELFELQQRLQGLLMDEVRYTYHPRADAYIMRVGEDVIFVLRRESSDDGGTMYYSCVFEEDTFFETPTKPVLQEAPQTFLNELQA